MPYENVIYEKKDHIATITLNRPDVLNAQSAGLLADLAAACNEVDADHDVRVAIITGAGRGFCSGGDLRQ